MSTFEEDLEARMDHVMADTKYVEAYRKQAWSYSPQLLDLWDDTEREFVIPEESWPESTPDAFAFIRADVTIQVLKARGDDADEVVDDVDPEAGNRLREMVEDGR